MPTREQINALIRNWKADPCWDLWNAEGFEEHEEELRKVQEEHEAFLRIKQAEKKRLMTQWDYILDRIITEGSQEHPDYGLPIALALVNIGRILDENTVEWSKQ